MKSVIAIVFSFFFGLSTYAQTTYDVGPSFAKTKLSDVPWNLLGPGDVVNIHYDVNGYHEKFQISTSGAAGNPIKITGIAGPNGEKPIIDGDQAKAISGQLCYASIQPYGIIFISPGIGGNGSCIGAYSPIPHDIVIDGLEIRNAHSSKTFSVDGGVQTAYDVFSCGIYAERVQNLVVKNCNFNHCGLGLFINSKFGTHALSKNILVESNYFTQNGEVGDGHLHNSYIEAEDVIYQYNFYDHLVSGAPGASLKDRSAGNIIRYNWIIASEGHAIQIPETQGGEGYLDLLPKYKETFIYGNVIYNPKQGATRIIRYGGDQSIYANYRQGTLYFYNNTVINIGDKISAPGQNRYNTALFLLPDKGEVGNVPIVEKIDCRNNIIYNTFGTNGFAPTTLNLLSTDLTGTLNLNNNWLSPGIIDFYTYYQSSNTGTVTHTNDIYGDNGQNLPGFNDFANQDFSLSPTSNAVNQGTALATAALAYPVLEEYVKDFMSKPRNTSGSIDLGAYENTLIPMVNVTGISISPSIDTIGMGQLKHLIASILPANASDKTMLWTSSDNNIATVSGGDVLGIAGGTVTITATSNDGGFTASSQILVKQTVVAWDFKTQSRNASQGLSINLSEQIGREPVYVGIYDFTAIGANGAGDYCLSTPNWDNGADVDYYQINFATTGFQNLIFSSKQRGSGVGPSDFEIQYRIGNSGSWSSMSTVKVLTDWISGIKSSLILPVSCNNQANVQVRWLLKSNVAVNNLPIISTGSARIDDIQIIGDPIPPCPDKLHLLGNITNGKYTASKSIDTQETGQTKITSGSDVIFTGGKSVTLSPTFEAEKGSIFLIYIGGCDD